MKAWLRQHRQAFAAALRRLGVLNSAVIGIALALPVTGYALVESLRGLTERIRLDPQISVFLPVDAKRADAETVGVRLRSDPRVAGVRFVPREQALKDLSMVQGVPELVAALGRNPLPDAYLVTARADTVEAVAADLARVPGVAHVQAEAVWARRLASLTRAGRLGLWLLAGLLGAGLVAVTFNTIRLQILTQREEMEVARLIGATDAFIGRPFYYAGLLQGAAGGAVALGLTAGGLALLNLEIQPLAQSYGSAFRLQFLAAEDAAAVIAFSGLLGWLGAHLSVRRHLA